MKLRGTIAALAATCWVSVASAQPAQQDRPLEVHLTGTLLPVTEEYREDLVTVKVFFLLRYSVTPPLRRQGRKPLYLAASSGLTLTLSNQGKTSRSLIV